VDFERTLAPWTEDDAALDDERFFNESEWDVDGALPDDEDEDFLSFRPLFFDMMEIIYNRMSFIRVIEYSLKLLNESI
jgi:hypothetical protein